MSDKVQQQNEIRRAMKAKQKLGSGKRKNDNIVEDVKFTRHVSGKFSEPTQELIKQKFHLNPETPITTEYFKKVLSNGSLFVTVSEEDSPSTEVEITSSGIYPILRNGETVSRMNIKIYTVTVFTAGGFGVKFKSLKETNRVIIL